MTEEELVALGVVTKPHGLRGDVWVKLFNPDSPLIAELEQVVIRRNGETDVLEIVRRRIDRDMMVVTFEGVTTREAAEDLRGFELCVPRAAFMELDEGEFYHVDLERCVAHDENGNVLGPVLRVIEYPSVDCLEVRMEDGVREIPLVDDYVESIDVKARVVVVRNWSDFDAHSHRSA
jgi:16S rRNA processing protein RimM